MVLQTDPTCFCCSHAQVAQLSLPHLKGQTDETLFQYNFRKFSCILFLTYTTDLSREDQRPSCVAQHCTHSSMGIQAQMVSAHVVSEVTGLCCVKTLKRYKNASCQHKTTRAEHQKYLCWGKKALNVSSCLEGWYKKKRDVKKCDILPALEGWSWVGRFMSCS